MILCDLAEENLLYLKLIRLEFLLHWNMRAASFIQKIFPWVLDSSERGMTHDLIPPLTKPKIQLKWEKSYLF